MIKESLLKETDRLNIDIHAYLIKYCSGSRNALKAKFLAGAFNTSIREINRSIRLLRKKGILIGSSKRKPHGYYIPITNEEVRDYLSDFKRELFDMLQTYNRQKRAVKDHTDQIRQERFAFRESESGQLTIF